jgi:hypothetical protein
MANWVKKVEEEGVASLPEPVREALDVVENASMKPFKSSMRKRGFSSEKEPEFDKGRQVWSHKDTPGLIYKFGVDYNNWQNEMECMVWNELKNPNFPGEVPEQVREYLIPIIANDTVSGNCQWLIMPKAEMGTVTEQEVVDLVSDMLETGWVVSDFHTGNIGKYEGKAVFVDYGQFKPDNYIDKDWEEKIRSKDWA